MHTTSLLLLSGHVPDLVDIILKSRAMPAIRRQDIAVRDISRRQTSTLRTSVFSLPCLLQRCYRAALTSSFSHTTQKATKPYRFLQVL